MDLNPGERIVFRGHPSWRSILGLYLKGAALAALTAALAAAATEVFGDGVDGGLVWLIALAGAALTLLTGFVRRMSTAYTITNRRLHIRRGIVSREIQETRLERVQNVGHSQSVFERLVGVGTVEFDTAAGDDYELRFAGVAGPAGIVAMVDQATEQGEAR